MPYLVVSTGYPAGHWGKTSILGGDATDLTGLEHLESKTKKKPEYKSSIGYWHEVSMPGRELVEELTASGYRLISQCANDKEVFWTMHKPR